MLLLAIAAVIWVLVHVGIAGTAVRGAVVRRIGDGAFQGVFSVVSLASIAALVMAYRRAPLVPLWQTPNGALYVYAGLMLLAAVLLVGSLAAPNPTAAGQSIPATGAEGITRITRHPMLWSFAIWAGVHMAANGDLAALTFFGAFGVTALAGMPSIDSKLAARDPQHWAALAATSSIVPFAAVAAGRTRVGWRDIPWLVPVAGVVLWIALIKLHPWIIGVPVLPR